LHVSIPVTKISGQGRWRGDPVKSPC